MANKFFNRILGKPLESDGKYKEKESHDTDNIVDLRKRLIRLIVDHFGQEYGRTEPYTEIFVIWVDNKKPQYQSLVRMKEFEGFLRKELRRRQLGAASEAKIEFKADNLPKGTDYLELKNDEIDGGIFIQRKEETEHPGQVSTRANISVLNKRGSLAKRNYPLDVSRQREYNIGRGDGNDNHIIILEQDTEHPENEYVSHCHAKIVFVEGNGFCLQTRNIKKRTIIKRNNNRFADITDIHSRISLKNGDEIELGKNVSLLFKEIID